MADYNDLKEAACKANLDIVRAGLVVLTWGNASVADRARGVMAIKPSGVDYDMLSPEHIVVLDLESGELVEKDALQPSSDTATHRLLYQHFEAVGAIVHTHSAAATAWAQAGRELPCYGTTHADHFYGAVPVTRPLTEAEIRVAYEHNTGVVIAERFAELDPLERPAVLVPGHGPFAWGATATKAVENAIVLESVAAMALDTLRLSPDQPPLPQPLLDKHFLRKHGKGAYYGQK